MRPRFYQSVRSAQLKTRHNSYFCISHNMNEVIFSSYELYCKHCRSVVESRGFGREVRYSFDGMNVESQSPKKVLKNFTFLLASLKGATCYKK